MGVATIAVLATVLLGLVAAAGIVAGSRLRTVPSDDGHRAERRRVVATIGLDTSILFTIMLAMGGLQLLVLSPCG